MNILHCGQWVDFKGYLMYTDDKAMPRKIVSVFLVILIIICGGIFAKKFFFEYFGFCKGDYTVVYESNSHGGINGDGHYCFVLDCSNNKEKALKTVKNWKSLPLTDNLESLVYGELRYNSSSISEMAHIP